MAELDRDHPASSPTRGLRIIEADDAGRRALEAAIARDVLPHLVAGCRPRSAGRASAVAAGAEPRRLDRLVDGTNTALEALRELTRGVFPTQLARSGLEPALRSLLARSGAGRRRVAVALGAAGRFAAAVEAARLLLLRRGRARGRPAPISVELVGAPTSCVLRIAAGAATGSTCRRSRPGRGGGGSLDAADGMLVLAIPSPRAADEVSPSPDDRVARGPGR